MKEFESTISTIESGIKAQHERLQVISENIANANSTATTPDADPYRRKLIFFEPKYDRKKDALIIKTRTAKDRSNFTIKYEPNHPAAINGYVAYANVSSIVENADSLETRIAYDLNMSILSQTLNMLNKTLQVLDK
ncbi:flagellar basal body rod protein FlgC [Anaplasmataceae bacterium AB001_6]|nr:flagellar basal body rod protein FlgC [Anaplasmataceae bacterium AB001_6]